MINKEKKRSFNEQKVEVSFSLRNMLQQNRLPVHLEEVSTQRSPVVHPEMEKVVCSRKKFSNCVPSWG